ncbi:MAG: primosomal replication protein PriC [Enterobacteriaceae bacterium]
MATQTLLEKLSQQIAQLATSMTTLTQEESVSRRFNQQLFHSRGNRLTDYQGEIAANLAQLQRLVAVGHTEQVAFLADKLVAQLSALQREVATLTLRRQESDSAAAQSVNQHQRLVQYRHYEQRLQEMIADREQQLQQSLPFSQQKQQQREIAALYGRLQRCRSALRKLEKEIELYEVSHYDTFI